MKTFCFTVDDNIRFLNELTQNRYTDLFAHPYLAMYKRLNQKFGLKVQLNLFYQTGGFDLSQMTEIYTDQWEQNAHWLKLSFHSEVENEWPYTNAGYDKVFADCNRVNEQILRFATASALARTTTIHYCSTTEEGVRALKDSGVEGLLGLFGTGEEARSSYALSESQAAKIREGEIVSKNGMAFAPIDIVLNCFSQEEIMRKLKQLSSREQLWVMIHEQYFYADYEAYQPEFEEKLTAVFSVLTGQGYESSFFEELI